MVARGDVLHRLGGGGRTDAVKKLKYAEPRKLVARILRDAQECDQVLHVRRLKKTKAAILVVRDVATREQEFERVRVMRGAEQNRHLLELDSLLVMFDHALHDVLVLLGLVLARDDLRLLPVLALGPQVLRVSFLCRRDHAIRRFENWRDGPVVLVQRYQRCARKLFRKIEHVAHRRSAEAVDALRVVADDRHVPDGAAHALEDAGLNEVRVLVLIDEDVIELAADAIRDPVICEHFQPVEQQVVVVEDVLLLLHCDVAFEKLLQFRLPVPAPRKIAREHGLEILGAVHAARVD